MDLWNLMISMMLNGGCVSGAQDTPVDPDPDIPVEPDKPNDNEVLMQGGIITLDRSIVIDDYVVIREDTTIDLNGFTITMDGEDAVINCAANVTIKGNTGFFDFTESYRKDAIFREMFVVGSGKTLTIEEGVFLLGNSLATVVGGKLIINGGHFDMNTSTTPAYAFELINTRGIGDGQVIITNGNFSANETVIACMRNTAKISGGLFHSKAPDKMFTAAIENLEITGGTFVSYNPSVYIPDGYEATPDEEGAYTVKRREEL